MVDLYDRRGAVASDRGIGVLAWDWGAPDTTVFGRGMGGSAGASTA